ncbi:MAG TPA: DinB family protein [Ignavibacteria bacterium]
MKQYLIDFFKYNDWANRKLLKAIMQMPDKEEAVKLFSHFIYSLSKWMNRITKKVDDTSLTWMGPVFPLEKLEQLWNENVNDWIKYLESIDETDLENEIIFQPTDSNKTFKAKILEVSMQLNYHCIHHRAQILRIIRQQGLTPPKTDYIYTVLKEL